MVVDCIHVPFTECNTVHMVRLCDFCLMEIPLLLNFIKRSVSHSVSHCIIKRSVSHSVSHCIIKRSVSHSVSHCIIKRSVSHSVSHCIIKRSVSHSVSHCSLLAVLSEIVLFVRFFFLRTFASWSLVCGVSFVKLTGPVLTFVQKTAQWIMFCSKLRPPSKKP